jgi:protein ImuB
VSRIACLVVLDLPVAAACRADPTLAGRPFALTDGPGPHARVVAASTAALARGVRPGRMSAAQARAVVADLLLRGRDAAAERSAARALADVARSVASRVETAADGAVFLDAEGTTHLVGTEAGLATALAARAGRVGLGARVGVGASMTVAWLAAQHGHEVVPAGTELGFLAPLPLTCLSPAADVAATLARWGVRTLGDLARLPAAEAATRLGPDGPALIRRARGVDDRPLAPDPPPAAVEEAAALEYPVALLEPLLFVLRGLVERALARTGLHGVGAARVGLVLGLEDRARDVRELPLAAPTRDVKTILMLVRTALEARPPQAAIVQAALTVVPEAVRAAQLGLFTPPGPTPERLATTLARLAALCGDSRVGAPAVVDCHRPGMAAVVPFTLAPPGPPTPSSAAGTCRLAVRAFRPPRPVQVFTERDAPAFVRGAALGGRVVGVAGPWRVVGEWWSTHGFARDYYDLELTDGGVYRCYRESDRWYVDGVYD